MTLMERLKERTDPAHRKIRENPLMLAIVEGKITKDQYVGWLKQLGHVHRTIEGLAEETGSIVAAKPFYECFTEDQIRSPLVEKDLGCLTNSTDSGNPFRSTNIYLDFLSCVFDEGPNNLLGAVYVFEGAAQGGAAMLANKIGSTLSLTNGLNYITGHGQKEKTKFKEFGERVDSADLGPSTQENIVNVANSTFVMVENIYREVMQ